MTDKNKEAEGKYVSSNFITRKIDNDNQTGKYNNRVHTRFPPEPNGYLHIGHAKSICLNFGLARDYGGKVNLRYDDTNPTKEEVEYVESIQEDIKWLGFEWDGLFYASDYFDQLYMWAIQLIKDGKAYVDELSADEIREYRGTLTKPGKNSPFRDRPIEESLDLFERMKSGEFPDGTMVLRAKIDMSSPNINFRDPVMYRILHAHHHRTGDKWCIYPMYDWAHGQSDSIEGITHSICTLEFENNRPLYDWFVENLDIYAPQQIEFARLNLSYMMTSKRKLKQLVDTGVVAGWDDPRMPTLSGLRRRGFPPEAIRNFCDMIGVARANSVVEFAMLEHAVRDYLNQEVPRELVVLDPLKVVITNYPENQVEEISVATYPQDKSRTEEHIVPFSREIYIEREDFMEEPVPKYRRLIPGREVRLMRAYLVTCDDVIKDEDGNITEIHCSYDPETLGGFAPDGRKVKGTLHWVSAEHAVPVEIRDYEHLFTAENPSEAPEGEDWTTNVRENSLTVRTGYVSPDLADAKSGERYQFLRHGYYVVDPDSEPGKPIFNKTIGLRDTWGK
ncbi:MAG: glutamine--tRNA ligase/YqeY domain fusion protein [Chloroflexota bacterium]